MAGLPAFTASSLALSRSSLLDEVEGSLHRSRRCLRLPSRHSVLADLLGHRLLSCLHRSMQSIQWDNFPGLERGKIGSNGIRQVSHLGRERLFGSRVVGWHLCRRLDLLSPVAQGVELEVCET